ncbi:D-glycero-alpha-D-manno-heptose-1,7-bisphosphate 7-phosphatase [Fulvivirga sediminis]|uniref:D,D-heptose 1,7-bisphosphate phosphatase n=1 Tax=Fulvivirga sediminis TaxID=2803949 RepID=A0A937F836_9BACT|nr:HAD family hydrolase [Fulvivirga sediminis]MBL3658056.1 HAD family hydrolase [Fulvivirga sediminis]
MNKCVFLDRDGVINKDYVDYVYTPEKFEVLPGVKEALVALKKAGYLLVVITNQSGIAKGIYTREQMHECHQLMQKEFDFMIDHIYYAPWHPTVTESLTRKPGTLMFEKAIAKFNIDTDHSWMVGDKERDLVPAKTLGIKTIQVDNDDSRMADFKALNLADALEIIFG